MVLAERVGTRLALRTARGLHHAASIPGRAGTVTGSRTFLKAHDGTRLLVDCGLFQEFKHYRERNWGDLEVRAGSLDGVVLTHAHLDHSGWVPRLVRTGFDGPIYCTEATADLLHILWMDAA
ncbi:MAG: MBL fold metallo-hydrolase, partial [Proteobacteria bacterium]|nr:MBL fold metallo-hydrolase [Pseudomonadota bacterium]